MRSFNVFTSAYNLIITAKTHKVNIMNKIIVDKTLERS
nr:MAG TPA: hypothetical protein [Caudoviricetes sp.]